MPTAKKRKKRKIAQNPATRRFAATRVATLPPGTHTDPGQAGLQLRVRAGVDGKVSRSWLLRFKFQGDESRILLGHFPETALEAARDAARQARELAAKGIDPRRAKARRRALPVPASPSQSGGTHHIETLASQFMSRYVTQKRKRPEQVQRMLDRDILPPLSGRDIRTISPGDIVSLLDRIVDRGSPVMANRVADILDQMFRFAIQRSLLTDTPVKLLEPPGGTEKPRKRALSDDELRILIRERQEIFRSDAHHHAIVILLLTLARRGELSAARWADIDLVKATWRLHETETKTESGIVIPLTDWAVNEFKALKILARGSRFVLPNGDGSAPADPKLLTRGVARCQKRMQKLGIAEWTAHDLRRTGRTGLSRLKVAEHIAERCLNHSLKDRIEAAYNVHDFMDERRNALQKWESHLRALSGLL